MEIVESTLVTRIGDHAERERRVRRAIEARRRLTVNRRRRRRPRGRVWLNGLELGGTDPAHAHLYGSFD